MQGKGVARGQCPHGHAANFKLFQALIAHFSCDKVLTCFQPIAWPNETSDGAFAFDTDKVLQPLLPAARKVWRLGALPRLQQCFTPALRIGGSMADTVFLQDETVPLDSWTKWMNTIPAKCGLLVCSCP